MSTVVLIGASHRSAPLEVRERLALGDREVLEGLPDVIGRDGIEEAMLLSTCNRVEYVVLASDPAAAGDALRGELRGRADLPASRFDPCVYELRGAKAVRHVLAVASGLESMVLGEPQIFGQLKHAAVLARRAGTLGAGLDAVLRSAVRAAKRVRTETEIGRHPVSMAFAAVQLARRVFGSLKVRHALLVGAGKMGGLVAAHLRSAGVGEIAVVSRRYETAATAASRFGGVARRWDDLGDALGWADIVVCGTAAPEIVLDFETMRDAVRVRRGRPLLIVDLAVPRDVDAAVQQLEPVYLYDVDDLDGIVDQGRERRRGEIRKADVMLDAELDAYHRRLAGRGVTPTLVAMRDRVERVAETELARARERLGPLSSSQEDQVGRLVRAVCRKLLHEPTVHLKRSAGRRPSEVERLCSEYRAIFGLEGGDPSSGRRDVRARDAAEDATCEDVDGGRGPDSP